MAVHQLKGLPLILAAIGLILFIGTLLHQTDNIPESWRGSITKVYGSEKSRQAKRPYAPLIPVRLDLPTFSPSDIRPSFYEVALAHGTDKVTTHSYHHMYQKYLSPFRDVRFKMLEIGLGCDMQYGPGASYYTWLDYFPLVDLYYIEYDAACAERWAANTTGATIFSGDQADVAFLHKFMREAGSDFDVIIDDGGHTMTQQITSLNTLWPAVVPGGLYFCEDLQTSYLARYGGDVTQKGKTMMGMIKEMTDDLHVGAHDLSAGSEQVARKHEVTRDMRFIDCQIEVCAFGKKDGWKG